VALIAAILPFTLLALWNLRAPLDLSLGDQAQYLIHARALLEGHAYTDNGYIHYPAVPISPRAYPPGLPLLIALVESLGGSIVVVRVVMIVVASGFLYMAGRYLTTLDDYWAGLVAVFVSGLVANLALFATGLYTDFAFAGLVWSCALLVDRPGAWTRRRIAWLAIAGALAIAFRTAAIALLPALALHQAWMTVRRGEPWKRSVVPLLTWLATYVLLDRLYPSTSGYMEQIAGAVGSGSASRTVQVALELTLQRAAEYRHLISAMQFTPTGWASVNAAYHGLALLLAAAGSVAWLRSAGVRFMSCFAACYIGILLVMPWPSGRFLWPLLPLLWYVSLEGAEVVAESFRRSSRSLVHATLAAALLTPLLAAAFGPQPASLRGVGDVVQGRELYHVLGQMARQAPLRIAYFNPRDAARVPGVSAMSIPRLPPAEFVSELARYHITHLVVGSMGTDSAGDVAVARALAHEAPRFSAVFQNDSFQLYRVAPAPTPNRSAARLDSVSTAR
jgi:hypothetical protein